jgi:hypothetical protein
MILLWNDFSRMFNLQYRWHAEKKLPKSVKFVIIFEH